MTQHDRLGVDLAGLDELAVRLHAVATTVQEVCDALPGVDGLAVGAHPVFVALQDVSGAMQRNADGLAAAASAVHLGIRHARLEYGDCETRVSALVDAPAIGPR